MMNMPQMPGMPQGAMMGQVPMMMAPQMMMPNMMMGVMPMMPGVTPMMCRMTMEVGKDGITCKLSPMDPAGMDMLRERFEAMMRGMSLGVPIAITSAGHALFCAPQR